MQRKGRGLASVGMTGFGISNRVGFARRHPVSSALVFGKGLIAKDERNLIYRGALRVCVVTAVLVGKIHKH